MQSSHAYPAYASDDDSRRLPRPRRSPRLGLLAIGLVLVGGYVAVRAFVPDLLYGLRATFGGLNSEIRLQVEGPVQPQRLVGLLRQRLVHADIPAQVIASEHGVTVLVAPDQVKAARLWVLPQGDLRLYPRSPLTGRGRLEALEGIEQRVQAGAFDASREPLLAFPAPEGKGQVLLENRPFPPEAFEKVWVTQDDEGRPALGLNLAPTGAGEVSSEFFKRGRAVPLGVVLDGKLLSVDEVGLFTLGGLTLSLGSVAFEPGGPERVVELIHTRLPVPVTQVQ